MVAHRKLLFAATAFVVAATSGCASLNVDQMESKVSKNIDKSIKSFTPKREFGLSYVKHTEDIPGSPYTEIDLNEDSGTVTINASGPVGPIISEYAKDMGYGIAWADGTEKTHPVSIMLKQVSEKAAIRKLAVAAGYVAVFDDTANLVTIAEKATFVFHLPRHVMQREGASWSMDSSDSGSSEGSSTSTSSLGGRSKFNATGTVENAADSISEYIIGIAGKDSEVTISSQTGHISVRGNGVAIERVRNYLQQLADNAMRQVQIDVAIVDIEIGDEANYGINWEKTLTLLGNPGEIAISAASDITNPNMSISYSSGSIQSIINALRTKTDFKIITQPRITATNGVPTMIFDGQELPYLGEITTSSTDSVATTGGTVSYAIDGVNLSTVADILSDSEVHLTLIPSIMDVREFADFEIGENKAVAPIRSTKEALISTTLQHEQTVVLGGIRYKTDTKTNKMLPGVDIPTSKDSTESAREVAILLHARISPKKHQSIMFSENL